MVEPFSYRVVVEWSGEDAAFVARVPALAGCAAHGRTPESATRELWLPLAGSSSRCARTAIQFQPPM